MKKIILITTLFSFILITQSICQSLTAKQIIEKTYYNERSDKYTLTISIAVIRPTWSREIVCKTWSMGSAYGLMLITDPAKDKGVSFLRVKTEGWNWLPTIERVVKISPSQMAQSWVGSDFTNEDLLKEASIVNDYDHTLIGEEELEGTACFKVQAIPKSNSAVVWGKKIVWVGKNDLLERKTENYDEDENLVSTLTKSNIKSIGGKNIPTVLSMASNTKPGNKTVVTIGSGNFNTTVNESFFSQANMKKVK